jgi:serine/threonine-protein kinase
MASVLLAEDLRHPREVAVKVLHPELAGRVGVDRFLHEIGVTARLQHPNILPLLDSGRWGDLPYYVMPYLACNSLDRSLRRRHTRSLQDAYLIARDVADALDYSHGNDIVHLDVKPGNILLSEGHAYVSDFGIARALCDGCRERNAPVPTVGTPEYMSPEQASGAEVLTGRSDVYSLAVVLYEMLTGSPPFRGLTAEAVMFHQVTTSPRPISDLRPEVPGGVDDAILAGLAKMPGDRPATAGALTASLAQAIGADRWRRRGRYRSGARASVPAPGPFLELR